MSSEPNVVESLIGNSTEYVETRFNLLKLKLVDKTADLASSLLAILPLLLTFFIVFVLLNIGVALLIGDLLGKAYLGFLVLTAIYIIIGLVLYNGRNKWLKTPVANLIIRKFLKGSKA